jgi:bifunctional non-homologous end joining protein LigD
MPNLEQYRLKRNFRVTSEPPGRKKPARAHAGGGIFVVHKHDATRLHYDLRLEHSGALWSWAVTRGPSLDPSERRLAVHVEDHPLEYSAFEGMIPKGQYGAGPVLLWDEGTWEPHGDPAAGMKKGHIRFELKGKKLKGSWHLVRLKPRRGEKRDNWLLIKSDDDFADRQRDILEEKEQSVRSGRTIEEVRQGRAPKAKVGKAASPRTSRTRSGKAKMPDFISPCLARLESKPPVGEQWLHEVKFDGYRMQALLGDGKTRLLTRTGLDWTARFGAEIPETLASLPAETAVVDGEIVVLSDKGLSVFSELQLALSEKRTDRMLFYVFDLLQLDDEDLRSEPLLRRKERLRELLQDLDPEGPVRFSEHFTEPGKVILEHACRMGLEGVISKRAHAPYRSGRGHDWIKSKCTLRQEFVITGYVPSEARGRGIRSLVLGYHQDGELRSAGRVGTGFSGRMTADLKRKLDPLKAKSSPVSGVAAKEKGIFWVQPKLVAEVEFRSWTRGGNIRQASFQGLREDKPAAEVIVEKPATEKKPVKQTGKNTPAQPRGSAKTSITLTNADKELWPDEDITKQDLFDYYALVWPRMAEFVVNRPLALVRAPDGINGQRFFQKHSMPGMHRSILKSHDPEDNEEILYIKDFDGLAALVQLGVVDVHIWGAPVDKIGTPDQIVFDLDPDEGVSLDDVRRAALEVKERLDELELPNFVKTSGGKGFHIMVPLKPKADWETVKGFAHDFARAMAGAGPERYTATLSKKARKGRTFIDYLRNGRGSTTVAPYSSRGKKGAPVSMPIAWEMIADGVGPADYTIGGDNLQERLKASDPWAGFFSKAKLLGRR